MTPPSRPTAKAFSTSAMKAGKNRSGAMTLQAARPCKRAISKPMSAVSKLRPMARNLPCGATSPATAWNSAARKMATRPSLAPARAANMTSCSSATGTLGKPPAITAAFLPRCWGPTASLVRSARRWTAIWSAMRRPNRSVGVKRSPGQRTVAASFSRCARPTATRPNPPISIYTVPH